MLLTTVCWKAKTWQIDKGKNKIKEKTKTETRKIHQNKTLNPHQWAAVVCRFRGGVGERGCIKRQLYCEISVQKKKKKRKNMKTVGQAPDIKLLLSLKTQLLLFVWTLSLTMMIAITVHTSTTFLNNNYNYRRTTTTSSISKDTNEATEYQTISTLLTPYESHDHPRGNTSVSPE